MEHEPCFFRDRDQAIACARTFDADLIFTSDGISLRMDVPNDDPKTIAALAILALWNGRGGLHFGDVARHLTRDHFTQLASLVLAARNGHTAIDNWIATVGGAS